MGTAERELSPYYIVLIRLSRAITGAISGANTQDWRQMINLNLLGLMYATHAALDCMYAQGSGDIVNISSIAGRVSGANFGVYCASKFDATAFTEALRQEEVKNNIRVIVVEPGTVKTELSSHITNEASREEIEKWKDSMTLLDPADIRPSCCLCRITAPPRQR